MSDFWSRRRARVIAEDRALAAEVELTQRELQEAELAQLSDDEVLAALDLPSPGTVDTAELLQRFMRSTLPRRLKQQALRQYWRRKPVLACLDGLVDYANDYTDAATCVPDLQTSYQVGKGLLTHVEAVARAAEAPPELSQAEAQAVPDDDAVKDAAEVVDDHQPIDEAAPPHQEMPPAQVMPARRMRFRFEETV